MFTTTFTQYSYFFVTTKFNIMIFFVFLYYVSFIQSIVIISWRISLHPGHLLECSNQLSKQPKQKLWLHGTTVVIALFISFWWITSFFVCKQMTHFQLYGSWSMILFIDTVWKVLHVFVSVPAPCIARLFSVS